MFHGRERGRQDDGKKVKKYFAFVLKCGIVKEGRERIMKNILCGLIIIVVLGYAAAKPAVKATEMVITPINLALKGK